MKLLPYAGDVPSDLPTAPGWPHEDTAPGLGFAAHGAWTWLIVDDDGRIAGECGVKGPPDGDGIVEIGYGLAGPSRGRGLGGRAVATLVDELRRRPGVRAIEAEIAPDNVASRRVVERLGFTLTDAGEEHVRYRLVVSA